MSKNVQTTAQLKLISHTSKVTLKILQARLQQYMTVNFEMFKLDLEKAEEPEIKLPTSAGSTKKQSSRKKKKTHLFLLYQLCQSLCADPNKLWKILKEMGIPDHLT